jgi:hypothetical protein
VSLLGGLEETAVASVWKEAGASHPSSVGSGSEAGCLDASTENVAGTSGARIQADGVEQPRASGRTQAFGRLGASATVSDVVALS